MLDGQAIATAGEYPAPLAWKPFPPWAVRHLLAISASGLDIDPNTVVELFRRVEQYRGLHGHVAGDCEEDSALGAVPSDPVRLAEFRLLEHDLAATTAMLDRSRGIT